jgi:thiamine biosynthesis lipoprotein
LSVVALDSMATSTDSAADVARINRAAGDSAVTVDSQVLHLLNQARDAWLISGGTLDPTAAPLVDALQRREQVGLVPSRATMDSLLALVGLDSVREDRGRKTVGIPKGMRLDLALFARGRAMDLARSKFVSSSITGGVLQVGSSSLAFGAPPKGSRWLITVAPPGTGRAVIGVASIDSGAVYVVADSERTRPDPRHPVRIVNAKTGARPDSLAAVVVVAQTAARANEVAAALYPLAPLVALRKADSLGLAAIIVRRPRDRNMVSASDILMSAKARRVIDLAPDLLVNIKRGQRSQGG